MQAPGQGKEQVVGLGPGQGIQQAPTVAGWTGDIGLLPLLKRCLSVQADSGDDGRAEGEEEEKQEKHLPTLL